MDRMTVILPSGDNVDLEFGQPIVLLGANGAGKTRFSVGIEEMNDPAFGDTDQLDFGHIHRLSAQKSLTISESVPIYDHESSEKNLFLGGSGRYAYKRSDRFHMNPATSLLDDYNNALSYLFSEAHLELQREHDEAKKCFDEGKPIPDPVETVVDKVQRIWNTLLPHRTIDFSGNGVHVHFDGQQYLGKEMSDGERVILYMIIQALVIKPNSLLIVDEPELHIHKSVVKELWTRLENERSDCVFMYLTHDIDFAVSRNNAQYLWIKAFDGHNWEYEFINSDSYPDLPDELLLEILGARQKIVFIEGTKDSIDYKLFHELYRDKGYHVIPCGGCQDVIRLVKAKKTYEKLHGIEVVGIIDRDYRVDREIEALKDDGILTLDVAEVENLFVVPEILDIMEKQLGCESGTAEAAKRFIVDLFNGCKEQQVTEALSKEISHQLSLFELGTKTFTDEEIKSKIYNRFTTENIKQWRNEKESTFNSATSLTEILRVFNFKELSRKISSKFGLSDKNFPMRVINVLSKNKALRNDLISALSEYVPELP